MDVNKWTREVPKPSKPLFIEGERRKSHYSPHLASARNGSPTDRLQRSGLTQPMVTFLLISSFGSMALYYATRAQLNRKQRQRLHSVERNPTNFVFGPVPIL